MSAQRDRTTVRRSLAAGSLVWVLVGGPLLLAALAARDGRSAVAGVVLGFVIATFAATLWLLVALALDLWAGEPPGWRRAVWTGLVAVVALGSPFLLLAAEGG